MTDTTVDPAVARRILALPMQANKAGADTIRDYLIALLARVWQEGEDFSAKRPFGMSGWECDLYQPLIRAGLAEGAFDENGYLEDVDCQACGALIHAAISELGATPEANHA